LSDTGRAFVAGQLAHARGMCAVLAPLVVVRVWSNAKGAGYGPPGGEDKLALFGRGPEAHAPGVGFHLAFAAPSHAAVDAFHAAAIAAGGADAGSPGLRPHYIPTYYAALVVDLDGHKLEAVCQ
jgi:hypothetical protein